MRRKPRARPDEIDEPVADVAPSNTDHDDFWAGAPAGVDEHLETIAGVTEHDQREMADDTAEYMGSVRRTRVDSDELGALAAWAESKACRMCRKQIQETHDPAALKHANCRSALRVERLLRRYT